MKNEMVDKVKSLLYILGKQYIPDTEEIETINLLCKMYAGRSVAVMLMDIYNYGRINGIRAERQRRRHEHDLAREERGNSMDEFIS